MIEFFQNLFTQDFMPHGQCLLWRPEILWLFVISDGIITASYYSIPVALFYFVRRREDLEFKWMFVMFGLFIFSCGSTHFLDIWTLWSPSYRFEGVVKFLTAIASASTAIAIWPLIPKAIALPSPSQLRNANLEMTREMNGRKKVENELRTSYKNLEAAKLLQEHANRAKTQFLSNMSHELRTPLNVIIGYTDLLSEQLPGKLNEKQLRYIGEINSSGKFLLSLINDLLDMSKIDAGAMELELEDVSIDELINGMVSMMSRQFVKKKIKVKIIIEPELSVVMADLRKCKQILMNLLTNALKFTPKDGRVEICAVSDGDSGVKIEVRDTGIGIAEDKIDKIFSEFYQAENVIDEQLGGTGIGLALTRRLVELHDGKIGVESKLGKGSTFWFTLPLKKLPREKSSEQKEVGKVLKENGVFPTGRRILIVEDNERNLAMTVEMLEVHNHQVVVARNGQEAIEMAKQHKPELILMDIRMPVMDGLEATQRLRAIPEFVNTPIIAMTASTGAEAEKTYLAKGCTAHLAKPIHVKQLYAVLKKYLSVEN
ncbi:very similar to histidine kinase [Candidatus Kuenenia stuttgartiensis]|uniref:histidine kinase n=1 Tax=Kuenenia stuttgartiensis TaxID=174633 RepID=Q1Q5K4_KUEST|nr:MULTISPECIES: ATP-binding protein [Kuenenia]MBE7549330.1 response regulator [Planctomycetia bacterium]MBZ0192551.1 response regulator [Candidatus Kuenenia stuttgartiensis]MCL4728280.1 response regulator [Candidatus Kuenenia stuttgartiensis]MCZ7624119.1 ATP-binding protein [Candidatus Kuenenia sp.]QII12386.1 very similar to histidine kinase [Candidatus Kuenenia stuttgartiensis]